ncbi:hypothetical protein ACTXT7_003426 [Hymenolepis weldensis]
MADPDNQFTAITTKADQWDLAFARTFRKHDNVQRNRIWCEHSDRSSRNPFVWLRELENSFQLWGINMQKTMYQNAFSVLPTDAAAQIIDIVNMTPEDNSSDT